MEKKLRHLLSFAAACAFIIMAMASFGPDTSTYLHVLKEGCISAPPITVHPRVQVVIIDDSDRPFIGQPASVFVTYQKITDHINCEFTPIYEKYTGVTDADGMFEIQLSAMEQNSTGDLLRVEVKVDVSVDYTGARKAKLIGYGFEQVDFLIILNDKSVL